MEDKARHDRAGLEILRRMELQYLTDHQRDYEWWTIHLAYQNWMDDAIAEYESNKAPYKKLKKMMEEEP